jgi:hypothetical protein
MCLQVGPDVLHVCGCECVCVCMCRECWGVTIGACMYISDICLCMYLCYVCMYVGGGRVYLPTLRVASMHTHTCEGIHVNYTTDNNERLLQPGHKLCSRLKHRFRQPIRLPRGVSQHFCGKRISEVMCMHALRSNNRDHRSHFHRLTLFP